MTPLLAMMCFMSGDVGGGGGFGSGDSGDSKSDLLLTDASTGMLRLVQMNGLSVAGTQDYAWGTDWHPFTV